MTNTSYSQQSIDSILNFTLSYRGLTKEDITIPINFDKDKSPTNDSKLLLPVVRDLMKEPMGSFGFMDSVSFLNNYKDVDSIIGKLLNLINYKYIKPVEFRDFEVIILDPPIDLSNSEELKNSLEHFVRGNTQSQKRLLKAFSKDELKFLQQNLLSLISDTENENDNNSDIFKFNIARDSSSSISKRTLDILSKINKSDIALILTSSFYNCYSAYNRIFKDSNFFMLDNEKEIYNNNVKGNFLYYYDKGGIRIAIGGKEKNIYTGHFDFIIDLGGDDVYDIDNGSAGKRFKPFSGSAFSCIIDLSGNDYYSTSSDYSLAGAAFSSGFIFDKEGDDTYKGKSVSLGSAICGLGVLYDESGNDIYHAEKFSIGAASFGVGLLLDKNGNDTYIANSFSQGFGMTEGVGAIVDNNGNDNYLIDARSLDIGRYEDHYISMSQGYGYGVRPYYAGGIGLIVEGGGNDFYATDIFGQGGAYWYALGCIVDKNGHDKYNSYQYAQGAGIHLAVGLLKDYDGWDFYTSDGVSQGCGHDLGFGLLNDVKGNDNYSAYSLSQGAGNANGIGMLIDESGRDGYLNKEPGNTRGYGNSRREYGSIGVFLDASGEDFYSVGGMDSVISNSSMWGVMDDYYLKDLPSQVSGNSFKIPLDSNKNYSSDEYFIMAKTIEPRFSQWQEFGFRKLVEDSVQTSGYILKYLGTDDHRPGLVLRNLAFRIGYSMGNVFVDKLKLYIASGGDSAILNQNEVAFICYLFGETRNPIGKDQLLDLTNVENIRIRSASVNALGKIKIDTSDFDFINKVSERLIQLAGEKSQYKLFNKDIAYAFNNYKSAQNIPALIELMKYDFFGVRFLAAADLKSFGDEYITFIDNQLLNNIGDNRIWLQSFLNSISNLSPENFKDVITRITNFETANNEVISLDLIDILMFKKNLNTTDSEFQNWLDKTINNIQSKNILKVFKK